jgi:hypothetical protein
MARYKEYSYSQGKFIPIHFGKQILPGTFEYTLNYLIDNELFGYLQSKAIPFVETPNLTLRRLFSLNGKPVKSEKNSSQIIPDQRLGRVRKKQPKTDLFKLVQVGLLQEGKTLYLLDYQGKKIAGYDSIISGKNLLWNNELYSMSELAKECLKKEGVSSESVRRPAHWSNADWISVKELWEQYLKTY